ncbi:hypothetical protein D3C76_389870 [compost metagenome]
MHQPNAAVQVSLAIPGGQTGTHWLQIRFGARAPFQQVRQHQRGQIDLVVRDHPLQLGHPQLASALQALQREAAAHAQGLFGAADQRGEAGQRLGRVGHPRGVIGVLHEVVTLKARQQPRREDPRLRRLRIDLPLASAAGAVQHHEQTRRSWVATLAQQRLIDIGYDRLVQVQRLASCVDRQGIDPRDALQLPHRSLQRRQAVGLVDLIPLLQHTGVVQIGVSQAVRRLRVPIQAPRPLHHRPECRAVYLAFYLAQRAILGLDRDADRLSRQR